MKKNIFAVVLMAMMASPTLNSHAEVGIVAEETTIKSECKEESKQAESPEIYYEECVAERLQALRDEQGGSSDMPAEKG